MSTTLAAQLQPYLTARYPSGVFSDFEFLSGGWECDIYGFKFATAGSPRDYILRLYLGNGGVEKALRESQGMQRLDGAAYPVPEILLVEADVSILGKPFLMMERLDGQNLWPVLSQSTPHDQNLLLKHFSQLLAQLHQLDWQPFTRKSAPIKANPMLVIDEVIAQARQLYVDFKVEGFLAVSDWLDAHKAAIHAQPAVAHLDFHANNVFLRSNGSLSVIDWSQLTVSDYRCDLAWTLQIMGDYGEAHWRESILRHYTSAAGRTVDDLDYFEVISYARNLASTIISHHAGSEAMGLRANAIGSLKDDLPFIRRASQRIKHITGLTIPEVEAALREFDL